MTEPTSDGAERRLEIIDFMRGVAILATISWHLDLARLVGPEAVRFVLPGFGHEISPMILYNGWLGVHLFFLLSGFVLTLPFLKDPHRPLPVLTYYRRRALRILPLFYITIFLIIVLHKPIEQISVERFTKYLFFTFHFSRKDWMPAELWILWSLGVEIWFSILFPVIFLMMRRFGFLRSAVIAALVCLIYRIAADHLFRQVAPNHPDPYINPWRNNLFGHLDDFMMGMLLCHAWVEKKSFPHYTLVLGAGLLIFSGAAANYYYFHQDAQVLLSFIHLAFSVGSYLIIGYWLRNNNQLAVRRSWSGMGRALFRGICLMGVGCYSLYVHHAVLLKFKDWHFRDDPMHYLYFFLALGIMGSLSYRLIERADWGWRSTATRG